MSSHIILPNYPISIYPLGHAKNFSLCWKIKKRREEKKSYRLYDSISIHFNHLNELLSIAMQSFGQVISTIYASEE